MENMNLNKTHFINFCTEYLQCMRRSISSPAIFDGCKLMPISFMLLLEFWRAGTEMQVVKSIIM